ncbi:hypothetical protein EUX98_g1436 [Antrodiella citrinella]|uniref:Uncharacterized protein n=1 Tax=Antrodiella citrinella TaxID=2447956 RepID=A0A4S4N1C4_9APHY|nr:hypothetical protein EUX98_g1436 [Antrodiella citrinella]
MPAGNAHFAPTALQFHFRLLPIFIRSFSTAFRLESRRAATDAAAEDEEDGPSATGL